MELETKYLIKISGNKYKISREELIKFYNMIGKELGLSNSLFIPYSREIGINDAWRGSNPLPNLPVGPQCHGVITITNTGNDETKIIDLKGN